MNIFSLRKFFIGTTVSVLVPLLLGSFTVAQAAQISNTSRNWAGYEATGGTFTAVSGTWTIPTVADASSTQADATWIGIGGVESQDLIQAGTQAVIDSSGVPSYQAWYETLPQTTTQVPLTVSAGDSMSASISELSSGEWSVSIRDNTTGQSYETSIAYNSSLSSAEWIEEMPSDGTGLVPLDNFGTVYFSNGMTTENGNAETISESGAQPLSMVTQTGQVLASPSSLGADGESFTVTRSNLSSASGGGGSVFVISRGGGRRWHRTGVGIQGYAPTPSSSTQPSSSLGVGSTSSRSGSSGNSSGYTGFPGFSRGFGFSAGMGSQWQQIQQILRIMQQQQSAFRSTYRLR
jgi:hypothetical protein